MKNTKQPCPACNRPTEIVWVHGHGQCEFCKINIDPCCSGEEVQGRIELVCNNDLYRQMKESTKLSWKGNKCESLIGGESWKSRTLKGLLLKWAY